MPGLVGMVKHKLDDDLDGTVASMINKMQRKDRFNYSVYYDSTYSLLNFDIPVNIFQNEKPSKSEDGRYICAVHGNILDYGRYENELDHSEFNDLSKSGESSRIILDLYIKYGDDIFSEISGEYVFCVIDIKEGLVVLGNDNLGLMPLYFKNNNFGFCFSSEVKSLIESAEKRELNYEAISDFLTFGYLLGNKTFFSDISLLPPASILKYSLSKKTFSVTKYWSLSEYIESIDGSSKKINTLHDVNDSFVIGVAKRIKYNNTGIALSGGMDSRVILSAINKSGNTFPTITSGIGDSIDKRITKKLSELTGSKSIYEEYTKSLIAENILDHAEQVTEITDGMRGSPYNALTILGAEKYTKHGMTNVLYGHGGELAKLGEAYGLSIDNNVSQIEDKDIFSYMYEKASIPQWRSVDIDSFIQDKKLLNVMKEAKDRFVHVFSEFNDPNSLPIEQKVSYYFLNEFVRKFTVLSFGVHREFVNTQVPFLDFDFIKNLLNTDPALRRKRAIHKYIIEQNCKPLLDVPLSQTRVRIEPNPFEKVLKNIPYRLLCRMGMFKNDKPETFIKSIIDGEAYKNILTDKTSIDRGLFDIDVVNEKLNKLLTDKTDLIFLSRLFLIELWFRKFVD